MTVRSILATDCGSTTTKAILIELQPNGEYRLVVRGEAPTTVEAPFDDVTVGVVNAVREVEELSGKTLLRRDGERDGKGGGLITPARDEKTGVDLYLSTSSAGGGLQMTVAGVVMSMSAESAQRAALGAGAIVIDVMAVNDNHPSSGAAKSAGGSTQLDVEFHYGLPIPNPTPLRAIFGVGVETGSKSGSHSTVVPVTAGAQIGLGAGVYVGGGVGYYFLNQHRNDSGLDQLSTSTRFGGYGELGYSLPGGLLTVSAKYQAVERADGFIVSAGLHF